MGRRLKERRVFFLLRNLEVEFLGGVVNAKGVLGLLLGGIQAVLGLLLGGIQTVLRLVLGVFGVKAAPFLFVGLVKILRLFLGVFEPFGVSLQLVGNVVPVDSQQAFRQDGTFCG
jgi:hypothetical protein